MDRQAGLALLQEAYALKEKGDAQGAIEKFRAAKATKTDLGIDVETEIEDVRRQVATALVQEGEALAKGGDFPGGRGEVQGGPGAGAAAGHAGLCLRAGGAIFMGAGAEDDRIASEAGWDNASELRSILSPCLPTGSSAPK